MEHHPEISLPARSACRFCQSTTGQVKAGTVAASGNQRYKCTSCGRRYSIPAGRRGYPAAVRERARQLRSGGLGVRAIARELNVNPQSVVNWLREAPDSPAGKETMDRTGDGDSRDSAAPLPSSKQRTTITDVARYAGVSKSTVSNYLNNKGSMSLETKARIRDAIEALQFTPSALMRAIRHRRTHIRGVVLWGLDTLDIGVQHSIAPPLLASINAAAYAARYNVLLYTHPSGHSHERASLPYLDGHIDGLLWIAPSWQEPDLERVARAGLPTVAVLSRHVPDGVGYVNAENKVAISHIIDHLYGLGHRRIAYAGSAHDSNFRDRRDAYREALERVGLPYDPALDFLGALPFWARSAYGQALEEWFGSERPPTALVLPDDGFAAYMIDELTERGVRVPEDCAVTGFNDLPDAQRIGGGLTTIRQPFREMGRLAVERLLALIDGAPPEECRLTVPVQLIIRRTTGALGGAC